jgi:hypothetical protein
MRKKFHDAPMTPRFFSYLAVMLAMIFVVAPLRGSAFTAVVQLTPRSIGTGSHLRMAPTSSPSPSASPSPTPVPTPNPYEIAPASGKQAKDFDVIVTSNECLKDAGQRPIKGFQLYAPNGSGIKVTGTATTDCRLTATLSIAPDAPLGLVKLWLTKAGDDKKPILQDVLDFTVTGITAGPIPPGLNNKGQVDVLWSVLPDQVVHDNFGARVATEYFCIDAVIGNDSGYDLQIASIGFTAPVLSPDPSNPRYRVPNTGYRIVRGTMQRRELLNARSLVLNGIKVAGPLLTGFLPFFHNVAHETNFSELINIISNPLEKGVESAWPDTVPFQANRLDDQTFRDDIATRTVIPNNIQTRIMTFVPKELLFPDGRDKPLKMHKAAESRTVGSATYSRRDPGQVMQMLGDIVIIGEQIQHINRIRVVATGLETQLTDRSISGKVTDACNNGVGGVVMTLSGGADFTSKDVTTSPDGTYNFVNIPTGRTYTVTPKPENKTFIPESPGSETFALNGTKSNLNFRADYVIITISGKVTDKDSKAGIAGAKVTITGDQIKGHEPPPATTTATGEFSFALSVSDLSLKLNTLNLKVAGVSNDKATFDPSAAKVWTCNDRNVDLVATKPSPTPTPKPTPTP